ncbi:hypothetical protein ACEUZ9_000469 [Paracoccus litorisediminis]|uniref:hypothetical protein n=1 Tax=Paracoccus litorisediminis TaxID=2006130 RepID=UPI00372DF58B
MDIVKRLSQEAENWLANMAQELGPLKKPLPIWIGGGVATEFHTGTLVRDSMAVGFGENRVLVRHRLSSFLVAAEPDNREIYVRLGLGRWNEMLAPGWMERAEASGRNGPFEIHVMAPLDIATSIIGGDFWAVDRDEIRTLAIHGLLEAEELRITARAALDLFIGDIGFLETRIEKAVEVVGEGLAIRAERLLGKPERNLSPEM